VFGLVTVAKFAVIFGLSRLFGAPTGTAMRTALALAQAGEFGLVLIGVASQHHLLGETTAQVVLAGMLLSMLLAPFLIQHSDRIVMRFSASEWLLRSLQLHQVAIQALATERHVVICGFGRTGQSLARFLEREGIAYAKPARQATPWCMVTRRDGRR